MDEKNLLKLNIKQNKEKNDPDNKNNRSFSLHTNPIIQKFLIENTTSKKGKFSLKDLFR